MAKRNRQLDLDLRETPRWGGRRVGAGRKRGRNRRDTPQRSTPSREAGPPPAIPSADRSGVFRALVRRLEIQPRAPARAIPRRGTGYVAPRGWLAPSRPDRSGGSAGANVSSISCAASTAAAGTPRSAPDLARAGAADRLDSLVIHGQIGFARVVRPSNGSAASLRRARAPCRASARRPCARATTPRADR